MKNLRTGWLRASSWATLWVAFSLPGACLAADIQDSIQAQQEAQRQAELQRRQAQEREEQARAPTVHTPSSIGMRQGPIPAESPCVTIHSVALNGADAHLFAWLTGEASPFEGQCLGKGSLDALIHDLNLALTERGFITSRVSIKAQSASDGILRLQLQAGRIGQIRLDPTEAQARQGQPAAGVPLAVHAALPTSSGRILNVRDLDHGAENIQRLPGFNLTQFIVPQHEGDDTQDPVHDLVLQWQPARAWQASLCADNSSSPAMGRTRVSAQLGWSNPLGLADQLNAYFSSNAEAPGPDRRSTGNTLRYSVPLGYHRFNLSHSVNRSGQNTPGGNLFRRDDDESQLQWQWLLYRDGHLKVSTEVGLGKRQGSSHIADSEIGNQRRNARTRSMGVTVGWVGAGINAQVSLNQTDIHRSYRGDDASYLSFEPQDTHTVSLEGFLGWALPGPAQGLSYQLQWQTQRTHSPTSLTDVLSLGGRYSVRGFTGDRPLSASDGALLKQELQWPALAWPCETAP